MEVQIYGLVSSTKVMQTSQISKQQKQKKTTNCQYVAHTLAVSLYEENTWHGSYAGTECEDLTVG